MIVTASTRLIGVGTGDYPLSLADIRARESDKSFSATPDEEVLADMGYAVVHDTDRPQGEVVREGSPVLEEGRYVQSWTVHAFSAAERLENLNNRKAFLSGQVDQLRESHLATGFRYVFAEPYGELGVQLRPQDCVNMLGLRVGAEAAVAAGYPQMPATFRTYENVNVDMTSAEMVTLTNAALMHTKAVYAATWIYKDQIEQATTVAQLPAIPATLDIQE